MEDTLHQILIRYFNFWKIWLLYSDSLLSIIILCLFLCLHVCVVHRHSFIPLPWIKIVSIRGQSLLRSSRIHHCKSYGVSVLLVPSLWPLLAAVQLVMGEAGEPFSSLARCMPAPVSQSPQQANAVPSLRQRRSRWYFTGVSAPADVFTADSVTRMWLIITEQVMFGSWTNASS